MRRPALLVADELPAMRVLGAQLRRLSAGESEVVTQDRMPADLSPYAAMAVYVHGALHARAERAAIRYAEGGGTLIVLHHSISSGKRANRDWFRFLGVALPEGDFERGGYRWIEGVTVTYLNLAPGHRITTRGVPYVRAAGRRRVRGSERDVPGFTLRDSEVYLNHVLTGPRTVLLGLDYTDSATGVTYRQDTAGWVKRAGKGTVYYFMPGHHAEEFEHPAYSRILANAVASAR